MKSKILLCVMGLLLSLNAYAMSLKEAKSQGYLGEQLNGYLGLVKSNNEAKDVMLKVNAKRRAHYQKIAKKNNISTADVAKLAGKKAINATSSGNYIQTSQGKWQKK